MARAIMASRRSFLLSVLAFPAIVGFAESRAAAGETALVFAASSLREALAAAAGAFTRTREAEIVFSFAASSALAKQIEAGAPADLYVAADEDWMNYLAERRLILADSRQVMAGNTLVIAAPGAAGGIEDLLVSGRFAMGDPSNVPAGKYAKAALESLGLWDRVKGNAVFGENVRAALEFVRKGAARAAIVYGSDLRAAPELTTAYTFAPGTHPPIVYPAALVRENATARAFLGFLASDEGQAILVAQGFAPASEIGR